MTQAQLRKMAGGVRLLALDLDGTALTSQRIITPRTLAAVQALADKGCLVVPTTGRTLHDLEQNFAPLMASARYAITTNGTLVTDRADGSCILKSPIPAETVVSLVTDLLDNGESNVYLNTLLTRHVALRDEEAVANLGRRPFNTSRLLTLEELTRHILAHKEDDVLEVGFHFSESGTFAYYENMVDTRYPLVDHFRVWIQNLEFVRKGASKENALRQLCAKLGVAPEETCAIGDNGNDAGLLSFAGIGVAMGNAIAEAQAAADYITADNDHDGAAKFIEKFLL